jgi:hypothetical protein
MSYSQFVIAAPGCSYGGVCRALSTRQDLHHGIRVAKWLKQNGRFHPRRTVTNTADQTSAVASEVTDPVLCLSPSQRKSVGSATQRTLNGCAELLGNIDR